MGGKTDTAAAPSDILSLTVGKDFSLNVHVGSWVLLTIAAIVVLGLVARYFYSSRRLSDFEIDGAQVGLGDHTISFKPNETDRQIAYSVWVELSTRKIGLPIDIEDDVIAEIYDSWYSFFGVTRELIKSIPVSKVRRDSTGKIIHLSIEVLNEGLRPHLTKWQARFRRWYEREVDKHPDKSPQEIQKLYPDFDALTSDLLALNNRLIVYRTKMYELVGGRPVRGFSASSGEAAAPESG